MSTLPNNIGEKIRFIRKERGLSQEELAFRSSLHTTYIGQLERGEKNATIESLTKICDALEIPVSQLFITNHSESPILSFEMNEIVRLLSNRSKKDQRTILTLVESLISWKDNTH